MQLPGTVQQPPNQEMSRSSTPPPSILFILTDQQACHTLSCYGGPDTVSRTPAIDRLAEDGILFERAYTPCALCTPARASLLTGLYPHNHGVLFNTGAYSRFTEAQCGAGLRTYPERLKAAGYRLGYSGKWHAGIARTAADAGFEGFSLPDYGAVRQDAGYREYLRGLGMESPRRHIEFVAEGGPVEQSGGNLSGWIEGTVESSPCHYVANRAMEQLDRLAEGEAPWFLAVNFWEPHAPYLPTEDFKDRYAGAPIPEWPNFADTLEGKPRWHRIMRDAIFPGARDADWETWSEVIRRYYAQAAMVDHEVERLLAHLRTLGKYEDCLIVFASDHGESVGIHGGAFDKGGQAYEELYRIPMIAKLPGSERAGERREALVSLMDLGPTFSDYAGTGMEGTDGQSLRPVLEGGDGAGRAFLLSEDHGHRVPFGQRILWGESGKYVWNLSDIDEFYDLERDPAELQNRIEDPDYREVVAHYRKEMLYQVTANRDPLGPQVTQMLSGFPRKVGWATDEAD